MDFEAVEESGFGFAVEAECTESPVESDLATVFAAISDFLTTFVESGFGFETS